MKALIILAVGLLLTANALVHAHPKETNVVAWWCAGKGEDEVELPNKTRVDCLTATHAIEADWAKMWYEAVGQSLYYASLTQKRAGILLIQRNDWDGIYYQRCLETIRFYQLSIDVWWLPLVGPYEDSRTLGRRHLHLKARKRSNKAAKNRTIMVAGVWMLK